MSEDSYGLAWVVRLAKVTMIFALVVLALVMVGIIAQIVAAVMDEAPWQEVAASAAAFFLAVGLALLVVIGYGVIRLWVANQRATVQIASRMGRMETLAEDQRQLISRIADLTTLSDQAKSLIFREKELEAVREIFHADLMQQDYQTADRLIHDVEQRFGYADEAERMRSELEESRNATISEKVHRALRRFEESLARYDWDLAAREANRLSRAFPDRDEIAQLPQRIDAARSAHKRELLQHYGEAVRKNDIDGSIELLRELDRYLTPQEASALEESARGVFRAKLHNLGVQFAIQVTDRRWEKALETGEQIITEFPNTQMAQEVRQRLDQLRTRAAQAQ